MQPSQQTTNESDGAMCPAMDPCVTFSERSYGGVTSYVLHHPAYGKYFRVGAEEYRILRLLNGQKSVPEVRETLSSEGLTWEDEEVARFIAQMIKNGIVQVKSDEPPAGSAAAVQLPWQDRLLKKLSVLISQRIPLADGNRLAKAMMPILGGFFSFKGMLVWCILFFSGLGIVLENSGDFASELQRLFDPGIWPMLMLFWCLAKIAHEAGHAVCAKYHGVRVGKTGVMFFLLAPLAYVDVTDAWKLQKRWKRVQIALAGVYVELAIAALAAWAWWLLPTGLFKHMAAQLFVVAGPTTLLVNANPLLRLDGYYVLSDLLEIPNLRMHGRRQLGARVESLLFSIPGKPTLLSGWRRWFATAHAVCSVVFQFFWMGGLIFAVSLWAKGLGILLAFAAFLMWGMIPFCKWIYRVWAMEPGGRWGLNLPRRRLIGLVSLLCLMGQHFCFQASPFARRVPVVVQHANEQIARASTDAFVERVFVTRGERVRKGMLLLELRQPTLLLQRDQLIDDLELARKREVQLRRQNQIAGAAAESEMADSLERQVAEVNEQIRNLQVFASRDGLITTMDSQLLLGTFVSKGDVLVRVADPNEKELLVSVSETDIEAYESAVGNSASIRLRGGYRLEAAPGELRPRLRQSVAHPALSASVGGPLAVEPSGDGEKAMRLVTPQLESVITLETVESADLHAGQIGMMTIADTRPLLTRIYDSVRSQYRKL